MKRRAFLFSTLLLSFLLLSSCKTGIPIAYYAPSEIDMGKYKTIAISSTVQYKGLKNPPAFIRSSDIDASLDITVSSTYDSSLAATVASDATSYLLSTLSSTGFFKIVGPDITDSIISASKLGLDVTGEIEKYGIDAFLIPKVVSMSADERITTERHEIRGRDKNGKPVVHYEREHEVWQYASMTFSYTIIDAKTMEIYAKKNFSNDISRSSGSRSFISFAPKIRLCFDEIIKSFQRPIRLQLVPRAKTESLPLMANKPKDERVQNAYKAAKQGYYESASKMFLSSYEMTGHVPSGYNAALLLAASGDISEAVTLSERVLEETGDADVQELALSLKAIESSNDAAIRQIDGTSQSAATTGEPSVFTAVMGY